MIVLAVGLDHFWLVKGLSDNLLDTMAPAVIREASFNSDGNYDLVLLGPSISAGDRERAWYLLMRTRSTVTSGRYQGLFVVNTWWPPQSGNETYCLLPCLGKEPIKRGNRTKGLRHSAQRNHINALEEDRCQLYD
jgi:hypothetical protein